MDFLTNLLDNSSMPWLTAILLGFMTSISPCPLATNITAIGFISKDIDNRNRVFLNGLFYTIGRAIKYTSIALVIHLAADEKRGTILFDIKQTASDIFKYIGNFRVVYDDKIRINLPGCKSSLYSFRSLNYS